MSKKEQKAKDDAEFEAMMAELETGKKDKLQAIAPVISEENEDEDTEEEGSNDTGDDTPSEPTAEGSDETTQEPTESSDE